MAENKEFKIKGVCIPPPPLASPPLLVLNLYLPVLAPNLHLPALAPNLHLLALTPNSCLPQICIYQLNPA